MSYTELYKFKKNGNGVFLDEVQNSHRGAMSVWCILEERYLSEFIPDYVKNLPMSLRQTTYSRVSGKNIKEVWDLFYDDNVSLTDKIVLGTTFDNVIVYKKDFKKVIDSLNNFGDDNRTNLKEQAKIIESIINSKLVIAIGWNQTSINGDNWSNYGGYNRNDNPIPYNILTGNKHWDLFEDINYYI